MNEKDKEKFWRDKWFEQREITGRLGLKEIEHRHKENKMAEENSTVKMNNIYIPTMHKPIPMGTRVKLVDNSGFPPNLGTGEVIGIASMYVIFNYIVLFDQPFESEYGPQKAFSIPGTLLETEDGKSFKLD